MIVLFFEYEITHQNIQLFVHLYEQSNTIQFYDECLNKYKENLQTKSPTIISSGLLEIMGVDEKNITSTLHTIPTYSLIQRCHLHFQGCVLHLHRHATNISYYELTTELHKQEMKKKSQDTIESVCCYYTFYLIEQISFSSQLDINSSSIIVDYLL